MNNKYYAEIERVFPPTDSASYQEIYDLCGINAYSGTASNKFRRAWNDLEASGKIEVINKDDEGWKYHINQ